MSYLIPILSQFENHYKMMLILTPGLILLVLAGAARLYADDHTKSTNAIHAQISCAKWQVAKLFGTHI